jgi:hypothetical protein
MRTSRLLGAALLSLSLVAACDGRGALDSHAQPVVTKAGGGAPPVAVEQKPPETQIVAPDAGKTAEPPAPAAVDCAGLAAGGTSDDVDGFVWQRQVADGQSSAAYDYVSLGYGCGLKYQHDNDARVVTMDAADCAASHGWATNARFLEVLRTGDGCSIPPDLLAKNATESFEVYLPGGDQPRRKTYGCAEPTLDLERACFRALVDRLFP